MVGRAQLSQERSRQRREQLLEAAISLFAEGGTRAVTHRAVATRAGLPPATTVYYFASIDDLVREALGHHVQRWVTTMEQLADVDPSVARALVGDAGAAAGLVAAVFDVRRPEQVAVELAVYLAAARHPDLRADAARALVALEQVASGLLALAGIPDPAPLATALVTLVAGSALRRQSERFTEAEEAAHLARSVQLLVAAHVLDDSVLAAVLRSPAATSS